MEYIYDFTPNYITSCVHDTGWPLHSTGQDTDSTVYSTAHCTVTACDTPCQAQLSCYLALTQNKDS